jgi:hypothetical protein
MPWTSVQAWKSVFGPPSSASMAHEVLVAVLAPSGGWLVGWGEAPE